MRELPRATYLSLGTPDGSSTGSHGPCDRLIAVVEQRSARGGRPVQDGFAAAVVAFEQSAVFQSRDDGTGGLVGLAGHQHQGLGGGVRVRGCCGSFFAVALCARARPDRLARGLTSMVADLRATAGLSGPSADP
ncbi:hypothetical protein ACWIGW_31550 [Nocardia brasiliensis]